MWLIVLGKGSFQGTWRWLFMVSNLFYRLTLSEVCSMKLFLYRVALQPLPRNCKFCNNILWLGFVSLPARKQFPFFQTLFKLLAPRPPCHTFPPPPPINLLRQLLVAACLRSGYLGRIYQKEPTPILPSPFSSWQERQQQASMELRVYILILG